MSVLTEIHRDKGIDTNGKTISRTAVRAVILRGRELLMVFSANVGDYKFPGGGVYNGELHEQALARELSEECGATIEYKFPEGKDFDVFKMTSHYYRCRIKDGFAEQKLDDYEADLGFKPMWVDIDEAIRKNKSLLNAEEPPDWLRREIFALEYIKANVIPQRGRCARVE